MAASDVQPEVPKKTTATDSTAAAKAKTEQEAHDKLLRESQVAKPQPTPKELTAIHDTEQLLIGFKKTFTDLGATPEQAADLFKNYAKATNQADRTKVFTDSRVPVPDVVKQYEAKYGASTHDTIYHSVALANSIEKQAKTPDPVERAKPVEVKVPTTAPVALDPVTTLNNASNAIDDARTALKTVQPDGKPLPDSAKQVFQAAIDAAAKVTPAMIEAQRVGLLRSIPGWTPAKEQQYVSVNNAFSEANSNLSADVLAQRAKLPPGTSLPAQTLAAEAMTNDPSAVRLKQADMAATAFYKANPGAAERDKIDDQMGLLTNLSHGKAFASALYATALAKAGNDSGIPQAKALMIEAAKDKNLSEVFPGAQKLYDGVMAAAKANEAAPDSRDTTIPGWVQTKAAITAMSDKSLSPEQRLAKAAPLFEASLNAAKTIDPDAIDKSKVEVNNGVKELTGGAVGSLAELFKPENKKVLDAISTDPEKGPKIVELNDQGKLLDQQRAQFLNVSENYALALSTTASALQAQANQGQGDSVRLNSQANAMTEKAATVLKAIGQQDPGYGVAIEGAGDNGAVRADAQNDAKVNQKRIEEEIAQVHRGQQIDPQKAAGVTGAKLATDAVNESILGKTYDFKSELFGHQFDIPANPFKAVRPFTVGVNASIETLNEVRDHVPYVGVVAGLASGFLENFVPSPDSAMDTAARNLANAKEANPQAANTVVENKKHEVLGQAVGTFSDIFSGQIGMQSEKLVPALVKSLPSLEAKAVEWGLESHNKWAMGAAAVTLGAGMAFGSRWAGDELSHKFLGTERMTAGEIFSHSALSLASAHTAKALSERMPGNTGTKIVKFSQTAAVSAATSTVFGLGEVNPFMTNKATGQNYSWKDTGINAAESVVFGGTSGLAGRMVSPFVTSMTYGTGTQIAKAARAGTNWLFNSEAGRTATTDAAAAVSQAAQRELPAILPKMTSGFMGTNLRSTVLRAEVGAGIGATGGFVHVNPWEKNEETGKNYTWGETATNATEAAAVTGGVFAAARVPDMSVGTAFRATTNILPGDGGVLSRAMGTNAIAAAERFVAGGVVGTGGSLLFSDKSDANGQALTSGQIWSNALTYGAEYGTGALATPWLFKGAKTVIVDNNLTSKFMAKSLGATGLRFSVGAGLGAGENLAFGDRTDANGKALSSGEIAFNATLRGLEVGGVAAAAPYGNVTRRFLGRTAEVTGAAISNGVGAVAGEGTLIGNKVVAPISDVADVAKTAAQKAIKDHGAQVKQQTLGYSEPLASAVSGLYSHRELGKLDKLSDEQVAADKLEAERQQQQQQQ